jgi:hypothetical protein
MWAFRPEIPALIAPVKAIWIRSPLRALIH